VALLSIISLGDDKLEGTLVLLTLGLADGDDTLPCIIGTYVEVVVRLIHSLWITIVASLELL